MEHFLKLTGDRTGFDETRFTVSQRGQSPQHRTVIDIQRGAQAVTAGVLQRLQYGRAVLA
jgi:hypothetical protein